MKLFGWELLSPKDAAAIKADVEHAASELERWRTIANARREIADGWQQSGADARGRAELAEHTAREQARTIAALQTSNDTLMASNDRLVQAMMEMRRVGYGLIKDIEGDDDLQDGAKSVDEEDEDAVLAAPEDHEGNE